MADMFFFRSSLTAAIFLFLIIPLGCREVSKPVPVSYAKDFKIDLTGHEANLVIADIIAESGAIDPEALVEVSEDTILEPVQRLIHSGFLMLEKDGGSIPEELFAPQAMIAALADLEILSLGRDREKLNGIVDANAKIEDFRVYVDQELKPSLAYLAVDLQAQYLQDDGRKAALSAKLRFVLEVGSGQWQITAYDVEKQLTTLGGGSAGS